MREEMQDRQIDLKDMFWAICEHWRAIIVAAIIGAVLVTGVSYIKSLAKPESETENADVEAEEAKTALEGDIALQEAYQKQYEIGGRYLKDSLLMKLDPNALYKGTLTIYVDNGYVVEYPQIDKTNNIQGILEAYKAILNDAEFLAEIGNCLGIEKDKKNYIQELFRIEYAKAEKNSIINRYNASKNIEQTINIMNEAEENGCIIYITIYGWNQEQCKCVLQMVNEKIGNSTSEIERKFGSHQLIVLENECKLVRDETIYNYQQKKLVDMLVISDSLNVLEKSIGEKEKVYAAVSTRLKGSEIQSKEFSLKISILAFVLGAALAIGGETVSYCFNKKLRLEDNFERIYNIPLLAKVNGKKPSKQNSVDIFLNKMRHSGERYFNESEAVEMISASIDVTARRSGIKSMYVTGSLMTEVEIAVVAKIVDSLKNSNVELVVGDSILYNARSMEKLAEFDSVILVEKSANVLYSEVLQEINVCKQHEIHIIGAIVIA